MLTTVVWRDEEMKRCDRRKIIVRERTDSGTNSHLTCILRTGYFRNITASDGFFLKDELELSPAEVSGLIGPIGVEATLFALLMSVHNLGGILSSQLGAILTYWLGITQENFENLWLLVIVANSSTLLPLLFLGLLPASESQAIKERKFKIEH